MCICMSYMDEPLTPPLLSLSLILGFTTHHFTLNSLSLNETRTKLKLLRRKRRSSHAAADVLCLSLVQCLFFCLFVCESRKPQEVFH
uniref:Uncharacterized protein n=1 Tax=Zea mays TaxID=4577 RepID=C4IYF6_MAIZE|nr:unknown [Zea mays]